MAKCSVHGAEVGTIYKLTSARRYMTDGVVLKNSGFGWKLAGKVKAGIDPADAYQRAVARYGDELAANPEFAAYRKELHAMAGLGKRWKLHAAVELMPDDCDGVWSEACDGYGDNVCADIDEVSNLCRLYLAASAAAKAARQAAA
jgi:hypothetical protein